MTEQETVGLTCGCRVRPTTAAEHEAMPFTKHEWAVYYACEQHPNRIGHYVSGSEVKAAQRALWLYSLKPGDVVGVSTHHRPVKSRVRAVTPTQIVLGGAPLRRRFDRKTGKQRGEATSRFTRPQLEPWLPKHDDALMRDRLLAHLKYLTWDKLTLDQLTMVNAALPDDRQFKDVTND